jgi:glycosyltransferase involved in cell wall biosynthesis/uncharacterized coiled-coil protein SlyX
MDVKNLVCYSLDLFSRNCLAYLRLIGPLKQLGLNIINGIENGKSSFERVKEGDIVFIQRNFPKRYHEYRRIVEISQKFRKPVVYDMDDLLFSLPENHPHRQTQDYTSSLLPMYQALRNADLVTVSTPKLRDVLGGYNKNITILPNFLDDDLWKINPPAGIKSEMYPLTIGYMGTVSHKPDLEYITPVLMDVIKRYPNMIQMCFWGIDPPDELRPYSKRITMPQFSDENEYKDFAAYFQTQSADIMIAPLVDNLFNRCKSPIKFLEYSALGVPGVFSSVEAYTQVIIHGENGLLAASLDEWSNCLSLLIENAELRYQLGKNAQSTVRADWLLSQNAYRWQDAFRALGEVAITKENTSEPDLIQSINTQQAEIFTTIDFEMTRITEQKLRLKELSCQLSEKEQVIESLANKATENAELLQALKDHLERTNEELLASRREVASYAQSTSWKITKPLRLFKNIINDFRKK